MDYIAFLHKDRHSDFGVSFPDFPGCVTAGKTLEDARRMATEALALHISGMIEDGEPIPEPSSLDTLANDPEMTGAVAVLISIEPVRERTVRINITARESQVEAIDRLAEKQGMTCSAYMVRRSVVARGRSEARSGSALPTGSTIASRDPQPASTALFQRSQIRYYRFGIGAVHLVLRHGRPRRLSVGRQAGHEELDGFLLVPTGKSGNVRRSISPHRHRNDGCELQLFSLQPFVHHVFAVIVERRVTISALPNRLDQILTARNL